MNQGLPSMSVIIPAYNEAEEIGTIVPAVREAMRVRGGEWEIVVVDDASEDATGQRLQPFVEEDRRVKVLRNERNRGKGYAIRRGMLEARHELRLMCDADCGASLTSLPSMEALIGECDIVAGARNAAGSRIARPQPLRRQAAGLGFIFLCRLVLGEPLLDASCGFKLFTAAAAEDVFPRARIDGWPFDVEVLALARALGYRVSPLGIVWSHRPGSRLSMPRVVVPVLRDLVAIRAHVREEAARGRAGHAHLLESPPAASFRRASELRAEEAPPTRSS